MVHLPPAIVLPYGPADVFEWSNSCRAPLAWRLDRITKYEENTKAEFQAEFKKIRNYGLKSYWNDIKAHIAADEDDPVVRRQGLEYEVYDLFPISSAEPSLVCADSFKKGPVLYGVKTHIVRQTHIAKQIKKKHMAKGRLMAPPRSSNAPRLADGQASSAKACTQQVPVPTETCDAPRQKRTSDVLALLKRPMASMDLDAHMSSGPKGAKQLRSQPDTEIGTSFGLGTGSGSGTSTLASSKSSVGQAVVGSSG